MKNRVTKVPRTGYSYKGNLLLNNTDYNIWKNPSMESFRQQIEPLLMLWMNSIKSIKLMINFVVPKDYDKANN